MPNLNISAKDRRAMILTREVLQLYPESRNSDINTILLVWQRQGLKLDSSQSRMIKQCFSPLSIMKCKRELQNLGLFKLKVDQQSLLGGEEIGK